MLLLGLCLTEMHIYVHRNTWVYSGPIHNNPKLRLSKCPATTQSTDKLGNGHLLIVFTGMKTNKIKYKCKQQHGWNPTIWINERSETPNYLL